MWNHQLYVSIFKYTWISWIEHTWCQFDSDNRPNHKTHHLLRKKEQKKTASETRCKDRRAANITGLNFSKSMFCIEIGVCRCKKTKVGNKKWKAKTRKSHHITTTCFCWMVESDPRSSNNSLKTRWNSVTFHNATPMGHRDSQHQGAIIRRAISWGSFMPLKSQKRRLGSCPAGDQEVSPSGGRFHWEMAKYMGPFLSAMGIVPPLHCCCLKKASCLETSGHWKDFEMVAKHLHPFGRLRRRMVA